MYISAFDLFKVGIGPSSSHTVGPMVAAARYARALKDQAGAPIARITAELFGSLAFTGKGHRSDVALMVGLEGDLPATLDVDTVEERVKAILERKQLHVEGVGLVAFDPRTDITFHRRERLPLHSNGMRFRAFDANGALLSERIFYSVGGGFIVDAHGIPETGEPDSGEENVPHPFASGDELLSRCAAAGISISALAMENERALAPERDLRSGLLGLWQVMEQCIARGCARDGILPGALKVQRRAAALWKRLRNERADGDVVRAMDWVNLWAIAVNEENAAGGRVVTAPTNGAAGIIPAVLQYYRTFTAQSNDDGVVRFLLAAAAVGSLYKQNASISGAEVGCQGEVGVACSMAAAGLAEVLGGTPSQVENAAEIGMEHNLGLTCDPIGGLVQVPCIERNAMGAVKAINAARLALMGDGTHRVSLDRVMKTMRQTGADMSTKYKETARGGLAVNVPEC